MRSTFSVGPGGGGIRLRVPTRLLHFLLILAEIALERADYPEMRLACYMLHVVGELAWVLEKSPDVGGHAIKSLLEPLGFVLLRHVRRVCYLTYVNRFDPTFILLIHFGVGLGVGLSRIANANESAAWQPVMEFVHPACLVSLCALGERLQ